MTEVVVRCIDPVRRDALAETARLALAFISVGSGPDFQHFDSRKGLRVELSARALENGCHLAESAQELLEAVQAFGVPIYRLESESDVSEAWADWWQTLPLKEARETDIDLEIR
ncbi:MAG TPA: hypothetical protein EYO33_21840 [Phycisphaerales bacterium]|nr:hypothetical protein [Phycisphaerales bacterium]